VGRVRVPVMMECPHDLLLPPRPSLTQHRPEGRSPGRSACQAAHVTSC
jgi:hypothetical protein